MEGRIPGTVGTPKAGNGELEVPAQASLLP